ncbi:hypothetical protein [Streptomyces griseofuscus]|uniref:hypothetical protein n=1 Tax=Streptomyces griseofuscus TaxID=146922 RepID=UPI00380B0EC8
MVGSDPGLNRLRMALSGTGVWTKVRTAVFFPPAIGIGMLAGVAVAGRTDLMLCGFVAVMFVAVFVRRFGMAFFFYGWATSSPRSSARSRTCCPPCCRRSVSRRTGCCCCR